MANATDDSIQVMMKEMFKKIGEKMDTLSTKEDLHQVKNQVKAKAFTDDVMEKLEGQMLDLESKTAAMSKEVKVVKGKTARLEGNVNDHEKRVSSLEMDINELEQYTRRWNLRVYRVPEVAGEKVEDCVKKVSQIFSDLIGVKTSPQDIEVAHRSGKPGEKARPVLVRFFDRKKRDEILANRRKLKNKGFAIDEDLTWLNYKLSRKASVHSASMAVWSSNGKILAKLKNNVIIRVNVNTNSDEVFQKAMNRGLREGSTSSVTQ